MNNDYSLMHVLKVLARWKKHIFIATGVVALLSIVGSLLKPNYYKSTAIVYAASPTLANPDPIGGGEKNYFIYGTGEDLDRLFSLANSNEIKSYIISEFNLASHYGVDTTSSKGKAKLFAKFNKLYEIKKTKYDGLEISIEDTDPVLARDMVKSARIKIEDIAQNIIKESQFMLMKALEEGIKNQDEIIQTKGDSLTRLKDKFRIYDSYSQAKAFAEMTATNETNLAGMQAQVNAMVKYRLRKDSINKIKAKIEGLKSRILKTDSIIRFFNEGVLSVRLLEVEQTIGVEEISLEKERLKKLQSSYSTSFTALHILEKETIPLEKSRPKRSILVLGLTFLGFVLSCLTVLLIESTKNINWREIYAGE
jgi:LPS O-antigen subunit length determinant protein (WzzB/FepE family)